MPKITTPFDTPETPAATPKKGIKLRGGTILPKPDVFSVKGSKTLGFMQWWKSFSDEQAGRCEARVYREWPVIDLCLTGERLPKMIEKIEGPIPFAPEDYEPWFLHRFGSGEYKILMNEVGVSGVIAMCKFRMEDSTYPPKVVPESLIEGHPDNKGFIESLKIAGRWKNNDTDEDDETVTERENEMAAIDALADVAGKASDRTIELTKQLLDERQKSPSSTNQEPVESATQEALKLMGDATRSVVQMVTEHGGQQYSPIEMMTAASDLMRKDAPGDTFKSLAEIMERSNERALQASRESNDRALQLQAQQFDFLKMLLVDRQATPQSVIPVAPVPKTIVEQVRELKEFNELAGGLFGGRAREVAPVVPAGPGLLDRAFEKIAENPMLLTMGLTLVGNIIYNIVKPKEAVSPEVALARANGQPQPGNVTTMPIQPQQPQNPWMNFIDQIKGPFLTHFSESGLDGYSFAEWIHSRGMGGGPTPEGRLDYMRIMQELAPKEGQSVVGCNFDQLIRQSDVIWPRVQGLMPVYVKFLEEFFGYDAWLAEQQGAGPVPTPARAS